MLAKCNELHSGVAFTHLDERTQGLHALRGCMCTHLDEHSSAKVESKCDGAASPIVEPVLKVHVRWCRA